MPTIPMLIAAAIGFLAASLVFWLLSKRKTTTKAEAMRLLAAEAKLIAKMPGAAEAQAQAAAELADEQLAGQALAAALTKASGAGAQP